MSSDNLLTEKNASLIKWNLYPDGDHGLLPPGVEHGPPADLKGDILEEAHIVPLAQGGFYAVGRTVQGFLAATTTASTVAAGVGGWAPTGYARYWDVKKAGAGGPLAPGPVAAPVRGVGGIGYGLKNPRGPITPKRMKNGMYLLLFYNNAGASFGQRDPYWLACGIESKVAGILWSQPEIILYGCQRVAGVAAPFFFVLHIYIYIYICILGGGFFFQMCARGSTSSLMLTYTRPIPTTHLCPFSQKVRQVSTHGRGRRVPRLYPERNHR